MVNTQEKTSESIDNSDMPDKSIVKTYTSNSKPIVVKSLCFTASVPKTLESHSTINCSINDVDECMQVLQNTVEEMDNRYTLLLNSRTKNIMEYNRQNPENQLPFHIVLIDEISTMISFFGKQVEQNIIKLAEKARATGIHLIITSNYFDKISNLFKAYFPVRMAFWVATKKESVKTLGEPGAETLSTQGEALFSDAGRIPILVHTPYVEE